MKNRKIHNQRWDVAKKLSVPEFWLMIEGMYKEKQFSFEQIAKLTYYDVEKLKEPDLDISIKHHVFITVQYSPTFKNQKRKKYPTRNVQDRKGSIMSSCREQHEKITGENLPLLNWESIADEKIKLETTTGIRHFIRRTDIEKGLEVDNIYFKAVKNGKKSKVEDFRPKKTGAEQL